MLTVEPNSPKVQSSLTSRAETDAMDLVVAIEGLRLFAKNLPDPSGSMSESELQAIVSLPVFLADLLSRANALHELVSQIDDAAWHCATPAA